MMLGKVLKGFTQHTRGHETRIGYQQNRSITHLRNTLPQSACAAPLNNQGLGIVKFKICHRIIDQ
jgi:hypothetical protein